MKNWLKKNIITLCAGFTLIFDVYYIGSRSLFLFGEPEFPIED